jgi:hypothetical protein
MPKTLKNNILYLNLKNADDLNIVGGPQIQTKNTQECSMGATQHHHQIGNILKLTTYINPHFMNSQMVFDDSFWLRKWTNNIQM